MHTEDRDSGAVSIKERSALFLFRFLTRFYNEGVGYKLPEVFNLYVHEVVFLAETLHDLVAAVVARSDEELGARVLDLLGFYTSVEDSFLNVRGSPSAAAGAAAEVIRAVGIHFDVIFTALLGHPSGFLVVAVSEHLLTLPAVVARIVVGGQVMVDGTIDLDASLFNIHLQQIVNADKLNAFVGIPFFETKPGRIVGVPSLG
jgi:hypothetical protein